MTTFKDHTTSTAATVMKVLAAIACIGAINWGLIGFFNWNLVDAILGGGAEETTSNASRVVYALVGLSGLGTLVLMLRPHEHSQRELHQSHDIP